MASTAATLLPCKAGLTFVGGAVKWEWASRVSGRVGIDPKYRNPYYGDPPKCCP